MFKLMDLDLESFVVTTITPHNAMKIKGGTSPDDYEPPDEPGGEASLHVLPKSML